VNVLAIDTATDQASVALLIEGSMYSEWSWRARGNHSQHVHTVIREQLSLSGVHTSSLQAVAVAHGPGSFNGIRVGISTAKGLAYGLSIPLVGISTLDIMAFGAGISGPTIRAYLSAGRSQVYAAAYRLTGSILDRLSDYEILTYPAATERIEHGDVLIGAQDGVVEHLTALERSHVQVCPMDMRRAAYLAELGAKHFAASGDDQLATLQPLYLRPSAAEEKRPAALRE